MKANRNPSLKFLYDFLESVDIKEAKEVFTDFLFEYFVYDETEEGELTRSRRQTVMHNYKSLSDFFDGLQELQIRKEVSDATH